MGVCVGVGGWVCVGVGGCVCKGILVCTYMGVRVRVRLLDRKGFYFMCLRERAFIVCERESLCTKMLGLWKESE